MEATMPTTICRTLPRSHSHVTALLLLPVKFVATLGFFYALGDGFLILPPGL